MESVRTQFEKQERNDFLAVGPAYIEFAIDEPVGTSESKMQKMAMARNYVRGAISFIYSLPYTFFSLTAYSNANPDISQ
jgi:hypothetical protein